MVTASVTEGFSLEDFIAHPLEHMEWVDGQLVETTGMTLKHSLIRLLAEVGKRAKGKGLAGTRL